LHAAACHAAAFSAEYIKPACFHYPTHNILGTLVGLLGRLLCRNRLFDILHRSEQNKFWLNLDSRMHVGHALRNREGIMLPPTAAIACN
jgi:hypothetical protein